MRRRLRMLTLLLSALYISLSFQPLALPQTPDGPVLENDQIEIPFGWKVGDRRCYSFEKVTYKNGTVTETKKDLFTVEIIRKDEDFVIASCNILVEIDPDQREVMESNPAIKEMADAYRDLDILVRIGNNGTLEGVENEEEIQIVFQKTADAVKGIVDDMNLDDDKKAFLKQVFKETLNFPRFRNGLLKPLNLMLMVTGTSHSKTEIYRQASTTEFMDAHDVPNLEEYRVEGIDLDEKTVTLAYSETVEGDIAEKLVEDALNSLIKRLDPASEDTIEVEGVIYKSNGKFEMNYENGWPAKIDWKVMVNDFKTGSLEDKQIVKIINVDLPVGSLEDK